MIALVLFGVAAAILAWAYYAVRRDLRGLSATPPVVVDPARSASAGGFGPEWDDLIAAQERQRRDEQRD